MGNYLLYDLEVANYLYGLTDYLKNCVERKENLSNIYEYSDYENIINICGFMITLDAFTIIVEELFDFDLIHYESNSYNCSNVQKLKFIRNCIAHNDFKISPSGYVKIFDSVNNVTAIININFFSMCYFAHLYANASHTYLIDDRKIDWNNPETYNIENLGFYRVIIDKNSDDAKIGLDYMKEGKPWQNIYGDVRKGHYRKVDLDDIQKKAIQNYLDRNGWSEENLKPALNRSYDFKYKYVDIDENLTYLLYFIAYDSTDNDSKLDIDIEAYLSNVKIRFKDNDLSNFETISNSNDLVNYSIILYCRFVYANLQNTPSDEESHIRNCLIHNRYYIIDDKIYFKDHKNGIKRESKLTFDQSYDLMTLYAMAQKIHFSTDLYKNK